jgi:hypothetical protein
MSLKFLTATLFLLCILRVEAQSGSPEIKRDTGKSEKPVRFENPAFTRNLVGPTAIPMKKGSSYFQNMYIFFNGYNYAFTDHFSLKVGAELISIGFGGAPGIYCISPRVNYQVLPGVYVGGGMLYTLFPRNPFGFSLHQFTLSGYSTFGTKDNNVTIGIGWNFGTRKSYAGSGVYEQRFYNSPAPTFSLGGMVRFNKRFGMVTENWLYSNALYESFNYSRYQYDLYYSIGLRGMGENFAVDFGILSCSSWYFFSSRLWAFPYAGFSLNFERKKKTVIAPH